MTEPFDPRCFVALASRLHEQLIGRTGEALDRALGDTFPSSYGDLGDTLPMKVTHPKTSRFAAHFAGTTECLAALAQGDPAAFEVGLAALAMLGPETAEPMALEVLAGGYWPKAREWAGFALGRSPSEPAFRALLDVIDQPGLAGNYLLGNAYTEGPALALARLESSPVSHCRLVVQPTQADFSAMSEPVRRRFQAELAEAGQGLEPFEVNGVGTLILYLCARRHEPVLPLLRRWLVEHPLHQVRLRCGHGLLRWGGADNLGYLESLLDRQDEWLELCAVKAHFADDPGQAFDRLGGGTLGQESHARLAAQVLMELLRNAQETRRTGGEAALVNRDARWGTLALRWSRTHDRPATSAKGLLPFLPPEGAEQPGAAPPTAPTPPADVRVRLPKRGSVLAVYRQGDSERAWRQLEHLGGAVRRVAMWPQARQVAAETMRRARACFEIVVERLRATGYVFVDPEAALPPLRPGTQTLLLELEQRVGTLPLSVAAAYEHLGSCCLMGSHPDWPKPTSVALPQFSRATDVWLADPFVLEPIEVLLEEARDREVGELVLSGDAVTKAGFSGGQLAVAVPCPGADARLLGSRRNETFTQYLRRSLRLGGFAGFDDLAERPAMLSSLVAGLEII